MQEGPNAADAKKAQCYFLCFFVFFVFLLCFFVFFVFVKKKHKQTLRFFQLRPRPWRQDLREGARGLAVAAA